MFPYYCLIRKYRTKLSSYYDEGPKSLFPSQRILSLLLLQVLLNLFDVSMSIPYRHLLFLHRLSGVQRRQVCKELHRQVRMAQRRQVQKGRHTVCGGLLKVSARYY